MGVENRRGRRLRVRGRAIRGLLSAPPKFTLLECVRGMRWEPTKDKKMIIPKTAHSLQPPTCTLTAPYSSTPCLLRVTWWWREAPPKTPRGNTRAWGRLQTKTTNQSSQYLGDLHLKVNGEIHLKQMNLEENKSPLCQHDPGHYESTQAKWDIRLFSEPSFHRFFWKPGWKKEIDPVGLKHKMPSWLSTSDYVTCLTATANSRQTFPEERPATADEKIFFLGKTNFDILYG